MGVGRRAFKVCHVFADSIILNNRSIANFCQWWKWEGHLLSIFCGCHKWVTSKAIIIFKKNCLESKHVQYAKNFNLIIRHTVTYHFTLVINIKNNPLPSPRPPSSGIYFFKANNGTARTMCRICSKLITIKTPERGQ